MPDRQRAKTVRELIDANAAGVPITSIEAATRQLETAIELWFHGGDPVSTHTLLMSAQEIISPIAKANGKFRGLFETSYIIESRRSEFETLVRFHHNFFKHGTGNGEEAVKFNPAQNGPCLLAVTESYAAVTGERTVVMRAFLARYYLENPKTFNECPYPFLTPESADLLKSMGRAQFYKQLRKLMERSAGA